MALFGQLEITIVCEVEHPAKRQRGKPTTEELIKAILGGAMKLDICVGILRNGLSASHG